MANVKVSLTINLMDDGQITVSGPIQDKVLSYGLLEMARDLIQHFDPQQRVIPVNAPLNIIRNN